MHRQSCLWQADSIATGSDCFATAPRATAACALVCHALDPLRFRPGWCRSWIAPARSPPALAPNGYQPSLRPIASLGWSPPHLPANPTAAGRKRQLNNWPNLRTSMSWRR